MVAKAEAKIKSLSAGKHGVSAWPMVEAGFDWEAARKSFMSLKPKQLAALLEAFIRGYDMQSRNYLPGISDASIAAEAEVPPDAVSYYRGANFHVVDVTTFDDEFVNCLAMRLRHRGERDR